MEMGDGVMTDSRPIPVLILYNNNGFNIVVGEDKGSARAGRR